MRKNPIARTIKKNARGFRTNLGKTPSGGLKSQEARGKTAASGKASFDITISQKESKY